MSQTQFDLIIVGAGILGLSAAIQASEQGMRVCIFEKNASPIGATRRNFGMVGTSTLSRPDEKWREYALNTRAFYQRIQAKKDISFTQRQGLYIANNTLEAQVLSEFAEQAENYQIAVDLLNPHQVKTQFNYLNQETLIQAGLIVKEDYSVEPHAVANLLIEYAKSIGISIFTNACVIKTQSEKGMCTAFLATDQQYTAKKILICHGEAVNILYPALLRNLGLKRCALQMALTDKFTQSLNASIYSGLSISRYPAFEICPSHAELVKSSQVDFVKKYGIHILIKQNQFGELIIGDSHEYHSIQDEPQFMQREEINQFIWDYCHEKIGIQLPKIQKRWTGFYLTHETELACVTEAEENIYLISAIAGKGMSTGAGFMQEVLQQKIF